LDLFFKGMATSQICSILLDKEEVTMDIGNISSDIHLGLFLANVI